MTWTEAKKLIYNNIKVRRNAWQEGFIFLGIFQNKPHIMYTMPDNNSYGTEGFTVTWAPYPQRMKGKEDFEAGDWIEC